MIRPGPIIGQYPEQPDPPPSHVRALAAQLIHTLGHIFSPSISLDQIPEKVVRHTQDMVGKTPQELARFQHRLQTEIWQRGLEFDLCMAAFALVEETMDRTMGLRPFHTQIMAAWTLLQGELAEMETGEGKTLAAGLAACVAALSGIPVHIITVNEYLAQRDARLLAPVLAALNLTGGAVTHTMSHKEKRTVYAGDVVFCTHKQVVFDYLRDRTLLGTLPANSLRADLAVSGITSPPRPLLRGLCYAIVDEADSVMIDDAITPLILSREEQSGPARHLFTDAFKIARQLKEKRDFTLDILSRNIVPTPEGYHRIRSGASNEPGRGHHPFQMEEWIKTALEAIHLLTRDKDYLVEDQKIILIDPSTGRRMPDRSWQNGLHQMVEIKEDCPLTGDRSPMARITYQRFFCRYLKLAGTTGTVREAKHEFANVYRIRSRKIPLRRPGQRLGLSPRIHARARDKWQDVVRTIQTQLTRGRAVLIGTGSVAESERLSRSLIKAGIGHRVLNARHDKSEADIVAQAGQPGQVTVATNMAGRGTDITLSPKVRAAGGLHVIGAGFNPCRRIDRQLFGRSARQGDPGSCQMILSLEDAPIRTRIPPACFTLLKWLTLPGRPWHHRVNATLVHWIQYRTQRRHRSKRMTLLKQDRLRNQHLAFSGQNE
ncbi:MAG: prepilin peptidase [Desulfobacterales bacterium]|nr:prepilin peptidase [Desulfobacterales bacterium]